ncbi:MFS transporter [Sphingomonas sp. PR090111-T3T-6A]|uniref:MFS transporter n=1 Tax=Sphingomonas sp. PR090111-T3T-6A TaxID=685778 RepID=UPI00036A56AB|nr:MFS transporter [Sphingomonas sp. PR090111-T3T-6A]
MNVTAPIGGASPGTTAIAPSAPPFGLRQFTGVMGVLVAAIMSGLTSRVSALALIDLRGGLGLGTDAGQWITTVYTAAELVATLLASWFAVTFSFRRFHIAVVLGSALVAILIPFAPGYGWLLALRTVQGLLGGALVPLLMSAALRFFPLPLRLYGLALYTMTATFAPNLALWLAPLWTDHFSSLRLVYLQALPFAAFAAWAVWWGLPQDPVRLERLRHINLLGLVTGTAALAMIAIGFIEGERRDWFHSPLIAFLLSGGAGLFLIFLISEWHHPMPFVQLQLLARRNLGLGFSIFVGLLITLLSGSLLPADQLAHVQGFRPLQIAPIGLAISIPQLVLAPFASFLLYRKWMDARRLFAFGFLLIALSCWIASGVTTGWMAREFALAQALQAVGQPMAVVSILFLATSVVQPMEGPSVSGLVNVLRAFGTLLGTTLIGSFLVDRTAAHQRGLVDRVGRIGLDGVDLGALGERIGHQAFTLAIADAYRMLGLLALLLIPATFFMTHIPAPDTGRDPA